MKIGFFTETYLPQLNGVSVSLAFQKEKLERLGHQVYIFAPKMAEAVAEERVVRLSAMKVINSEPAQKVVLPIPNSTLRTTFRVGLDVVHAHGGGFFSFLGYQLALAKGYPFVLTYHTYLAKYQHYFFIKNEAISSRVATNGSKLVCNLADVVVVPTAKMKKVLESYGVNKKIEIVPNPIDTNKFKKGERGYLRKKLGISPETVILLTVVRLGKEKNIDFLIKAFSIVAKRKKDCVFVIVGDGPEKENLKALAESLKLGKKVVFTGFIDSAEMPRVYSDSDVFLFASQSETQGMVVPEAAACGLPLVVVEDEAFELAVEDFVNGYSTSMNTSVFARKVLSLVENKRKREEYGAASLKLMEENFDPDETVKKLLAVYKEAIRIRREVPRVSSRVQNSVKSLVGLFRYVRDLNRRLGL